MASESSKNRRKMKQENPEAYRKYLDKQKKKSKENRDKLKQLLKDNPTDELKQKRQRQLELAKERKRRWSARQRESKEMKTRKKRNVTPVQEDDELEVCEDEDGSPTHSTDYLDRTDFIVEKSTTENINDKEQSDEEDSIESAKDNNDNSVGYEEENSRHFTGSPNIEINTINSTSQEDDTTSLMTLAAAITSESEHRSRTFVLNDSLNGSRGNDVASLTDFSRQIQQDRNSEFETPVRNIEVRHTRQDPYVSFVDDDNVNTTARQHDQMILTSMQVRSEDNQAIATNKDNDQVSGNAPLSLPLALPTGYMPVRPTVPSKYDSRVITPNNRADGITHQSPFDQSQAGISDHQSNSNQYTDLNQWPGLRSDNGGLQMNDAIIVPGLFQRPAFLLGGRETSSLDMTQNRLPQIPFSSDISSLSGTLPGPSHEFGPINLSFNEHQRNNPQITSMASRDTVEPNSRPTPYTRFINQQETQSMNKFERRRTSERCQQHQEPANIACIDCDRKLICRLCLPTHYKHRFTAYKVMEDPVVTTSELPAEFGERRMFSVRQSLYFWVKETLQSYNIIFKKIQTIHLTCDDGEEIEDICLSPDREEFWYCTNEGSVYQMSIRDESCALKFKCEVNSYNDKRICVTRGNRVLLSVETRDYLDKEDDSDTSDSDSDVGVVYCLYILVYTTDGQLQSRHLIERKGDLYAIRECSITGDLLINIYNVNTRRDKVVLTDENLNKKYETTGKSVRYHTGGRKKKTTTGYSDYFRDIVDVCFDVEGNILVSLRRVGVILMDHDTGMYIRIVVADDNWRRVITVQEDGQLCCYCEYYYPKNKELVCVKYLDKLPY